MFMNVTFHKYMFFLSFLVHKNYIIQNQGCHRLGKSGKVREIEIDHGKPGKVRKKCKKNLEFRNLLTISNITTIILNYSYSK